MSSRPRWANLRSARNSPSNCHRGEFAEFRYQWVIRITWCLLRPFLTDGRLRPRKSGDAAFKDGVNVELVGAKDENNIEVRFFERGVGETQSSGTGSCAAAVAAISAKRARSPVRVHAPGGVQTVRWEKQVFLRGAAQLICRGEFFC